MTDALVQAMLRFGAVVRGRQGKLLQKLCDDKELSLRDLAIVESLGEQPSGSLVFGQLVKRLGMSDLASAATSSRISQQVNALMKRRLVTKAINPDDQRQPIVELTEAGRKVSRALGELRVEVMSEIQDAMELQDSERQVLQDVFRRGVENYERLFVPRANGA